MQFLSDNAAAVHPAVWEAMKDADAPQPPYDNDSLSQALDEAFSALFGRPVSAIWVASGTAANCLALATMVQPYGAVVCHRDAHIENDEGGAPGFFTHGAKLLLADGENAKLTPDSIAPSPVRSAAMCIRCGRMPSRSRRPPKRAASINRRKLRRSAPWRGRRG
jgi:threonine aldolase